MRAGWPPDAGHKPAGCWPDGGRVGGRLSGESVPRQTALKAVPRVRDRVVGAASRTAGGGIVAAPALQSAPAVDPLAVAAAWRDGPWNGVDDGRTFLT